MSAMRARDTRFFEEEPPLREPRITVRAGESIVVKVGAVDRQSGVVEIIARCRSCENHDLVSIGRWSLTPGQHRGDNYYPVVVPIPAQSPTVIWELHRITLRDGRGNCQSYESRKDFEEMLFNVRQDSEVDCTPPRLLGVRFGRA